MDGVVGYVRLRRARVLLATSLSPRMEFTLGWYDVFFAVTIFTIFIGHNVHHSSEEYNLTTALRQSPIQTVFSWIFYLPFAFFFPFELFAFHNQVSNMPHSSKVSS